MREKIVFLLREIVTTINNTILDFIIGFLVSSHPEWNPRIWSNIELKKISKTISGSVVNVSAAEDDDKGGGKYKRYFPLASAYDITNYGFGEEGTSISENEKILDLSVKYAGQYGRYDVVLNHTVLEHLKSIEIAIDNLCALSNDLIITVVPFLMGFHGRTGGYSDYWRYSPMSLISEFDKRGFSTVYINWNTHHPLMNVYILHIASKFPERHVDYFDRVTLPIVNEYGPGVNFSSFIWGWGNEKGKSLSRKIGEAIGCRLV
ncbi:MAG: hypothetical protein V2B20_02770 [Pseudomonadota bacterium]